MGGRGGKSGKWENKKGGKWETGRVQEAGDSDPSVHHYRPRSSKHTIMYPSCVTLRKITK